MRLLPASRPGQNHRLPIFRRAGRQGVALLLLLLLSAALAAAVPAPEETTAPAPAEATGPPVIRAVRVAGVINPVVADFIAEELGEADAAGAAAFLIELDTPGGLDTAMREIIQALLASRLPVIVYVAPSGARAASAGALITLAADFAAMAPGTNIGAAHPVAIGPGEGLEEVMREKVVRDAVAYARSIAEIRGRDPGWAEKIVRESVSTPASEALKLGVIDLVAADRAKLLEELDGRTYQRGDRTLALVSAGAEVRTAEMNWRQRFLDTISSPDIAYLLLMLGILGIFFEIANPGAIFPGTVGAIALLLAFFGLQTLPVNYTGVLLIGVAFVLFILEIGIPSYGLLTIAGLVALGLGSLMLIDAPAPFLRISRTVIAAALAVTAGFVILVLAFVTRAQRAPFVSGREGLAGERGEAVTDIHEQGLVFVHGEYWQAFSGEPIARGEAIEVVRMADQLRLEVRRP
jgi:membrane-bound serine protease (ClpP class)